MMAVGAVISRSTGTGACRLYTFTCEHTAVFVMDCVMCNSLHLMESQIS